jgi:flagellum-specific peptidoglycan hydrolase FlgJ
LTRGKLAAIAAAVGAAGLALLGRARPAAGRIDAVRTPLTRDKAADLFRMALAAELGRAPSSRELAMLLAQSDLETGSWQSMFGWNFGNSVVGKSGAQWFTLKNDADRPLDKRHHYRAFPSALEGASYYVRLLKKEFPRAWSALSSGDPNLYAAALKEDRYYEAPVSDYARGLASRYREVLA